MDTQLRASMFDFDGIWRYQEIIVDKIVILARPNGWMDGGLYRRTHEHSRITIENWAHGLWTRTYQGITNCNRLIFQLKSGFLPIDGQDLCGSMIAELRVTCACYHYFSCDLFGNIPISTKFDILDGFLPEQSARKWVYDFILTEIAERLSSLSEERNQGTYAQFNIWAACMLMARMYLNTEAYIDIAEWEKCIQQCDLIINSDIDYQLEANQRNIFVTGNENLPEIILRLVVDPKYTTSWDAFDHHMQTLPAGLQYRYELTMEPWGGTCAIPQFISTFDPDDSRYTDNFIYSPRYTSDGEPILISIGNSEYIGEPVNFVDKVNSIAQSEQYQGIRLEKYEADIGSSNCLANDFILFRYADMLMMEAECLLCTGKFDDIVALVTKIRKRTFKSAPEKTIVTGADLLKGSVYDYGIRDNRDTLTNTFEGGKDIKYGRFLDELAWESNQEGRRRQDMIRFGVYTKKSWFSRTPNGDYRTLFPIPQREIDANTNLEPNLGYQSSEKALKRWLTLQGLFCFIILLPNAYINKKSILSHSSTDIMSNRVD